MKLGVVLELAIVLCGITSPAQAETKRTRVPVSSIPRQETPIEIDPKTAVLPDGAREGGGAPKDWMRSLMAGLSSHCTDGRRAFVAPSGGDGATTEKIWEVNGRVFFDRAEVTFADGKVHVVSAERTPVVYVSESVWAYRRSDAVHLLTARDFGNFSRLVFGGCSVEDRAISLPTGTTTMQSSPEQVDAVLTYNLLGPVADEKRTMPASWKGVAFHLLASVSRAAADVEPMLNLVITRP